MLSESYAAGAAAAEHQLNKNAKLFDDAIKGMKGWGDKAGKHISSATERANLYAKQKMPNAHATAAQYGARAAGYMQNKPGKTGLFGAS